MITPKQLHSLELVRNSCQEGMDGTWDCSTDEGRESFQPMIDDLDAVIKAISDDWYTPCAVLCCWLSITHADLGECVGDFSLPMRVWDDFKHMLRTRERDDKVIWDTGNALLHTEYGVCVDTPDHVWEPFNRVYELCDPDLGNHNMN